MVRLVRPSDRYDGIGFPVDNERRCLAIPYKSQWGARLVLLPSAQGRIAKRNFKQYPYVGHPPPNRIVHGRCKRHMRKRTAEGNRSYCSHHVGWEASERFKTILEGRTWKIEV
jgi:hypothetical protein